MPDPSTTPVNITLFREAGELQIDWADGYKTVYTIQRLRSICPCAGCNIARINAQMPAPAGPDHAGVTCSEVELCGNYAIKLPFSDGHRTGIYSWAFLRDNDPGS